MTNEVQIKSRLIEIDNSVKAIQTESQKQIAVLTGERQSLERNYSLLQDNVDLNKVLLAEGVIYVAGTYSPKTGEQKSVVTDFIQWLATGKPKSAYSDPNNYYFGTKNYDRFSSQREDHTYGSRPRHGSTNFEIGLRKQIRGSEISEELRSYCIYYLENLERIQSAKARGE